LVEIVNLIKSFKNTSSPHCYSVSFRWICAKFFSGFRRKHLFITACIEKQCTRPLNQIVRLTLENFPIVN